MPAWYVVTLAVVAVLTATPFLPRGRLAYVAYLPALLVNEVPGTLLLLLTAGTAAVVAGDGVASPGAWLALVLAAATAVGLAVLAVRAFRAEAAVLRALDDGLPGGGAGRAPDAPDAAWRAGWRAGRLRRVLRLVRALLVPVVLGSWQVRRFRDLSYGDAGERNLLDLYRRRRGPVDGPTLVYLHGGSFRRGRKSRESRALVDRLARRGWVCVSATYRFSPAASFPDHLVDVKKVIAWVRTEGARYGASPVVVVAGSSAGGHLAAMAALTPGVAALQPGFEDVDTSVSAAVCLYGYYGTVAGARGTVASSPVAHVRADAPPFFLAHGDRDILVPVEHARGFAARLRAASRHPVVYAELPGAQHGFDVFRSVRFEAVVDGVEAFATQAVSRPVARP